MKNLIATAKAVGFLAIYLALVAAAGFTVKLIIILFKFGYNLI